MQLRNLLLFLAASANAVSQPDAPGVEVKTSFDLLHRPAVDYPADLAAMGISGEVIAALSLSDSGEVYDARIVSGPAELRRAVLQSVLGWHFSPGQLPSMLEVMVRFTAPKADASPQASAQRSAIPSSMLLKSPAVVRRIDVSQLPPPLPAKFRSALTLRDGDSLIPSDVAALIAKVHEIDRHVDVMFQPAEDQVVVRLVLPGFTPPGALASPERIRVGGNVQAANLIKKMTPVYPPLAKQARIQGTVRFTVILNKDGTVQNIQLVSGHPLLVPSATDALREWVYRPTLLNGLPVEVMTQVDINFTLVDPPPPAQ